MLLWRKIPIYYLLYLFSPLNLSFQMLVQVVVVLELMVSINRKCRLFNLNWTPPHWRRVMSILYFRKVLHTSCFISMHRQWNHYCRRFLKIFRSTDRKEISTMKKEVKNQVQGIGVKSVLKHYAVSWFQFFDIVVSYRHTPRHHHRFSGWWHHFDYHHYYHCNLSLQTEEAQTCQSRGRRTHDKEGQRWQGRLRKCRTYNFKYAPFQRYKSNEEKQEYRRGWGG